MSGLSAFTVERLIIQDETWTDETDFEVEVYCILKDRDGHGYGFSINIVSPKVIARRVEGDGFSYEFGKGHMIVNDYDQNRIVTALQKLIDGTGAQSESELVRKMGGFADWWI